MSVGDLRFFGAVRLSGFPRARTTPTTQTERPSTQPRWCWRASCQVTPAPTMHDVVYVWGADVVFQPERPHRDPAGCITGTDCSNVRGREFRRRVKFATSSATFLDHVPHVVAFGSQEEVRWIDTAASITGMTDHLVGRGRFPMFKLPCHTVGQT